jgi:hypothetical protein
LSIDVGEDGRVLLYCHAGCDTPAVVGAMGLRMADLFADGGNGQARRASRIVATYDYPDGLQKVRYLPKRFGWRRSDGHGGWAYGRGGKKAGLYRQEDLLRLPKHTVIYPVEGEKDVDALWERGCASTCNGDGAGKWSTVADDSALEGRPVVILPDNDDAGRRHAQDVAARLHGRAASVKVVELPGLPDGGDVSDWLDAGNDPEEFDRLAAHTPEWTPGPPPEPTPYRHGKESMQAINRMAKAARDLRGGLEALSDSISEWFAKRGDARVTKRNGEEVDHPVAYAAGALGMTPRRLYQLRDWSRIRHIGTTVHGDGQCEPLVHNTSERALRPLARLLPDHADDVPDALRHAYELHRAKVAAAEAKGARPPKQLSSRDTSAAVAEILPPEEPDGATHGPLDYDADQDAARRLSDEMTERIGAWLDAMAVIAGVPTKLRSVLRMADELAQRWPKKSRS